MKTKQNISIVKTVSGRFGTLAVLTLLAFSSPRVVDASGPAPRRDQAVFEVRFLTEMINHHAMAVMMAELCEGRAVHPELIALCDSIEQSQTAEIEQMQTWLQDWYGVTHEPEMNPGDMKMIERLAGLSGEEFEIEFMEMMVKHHAKAIVRASHCEDKAYHQELLALCQNIIETQSEEIVTMKTWLCQWYDICNNGHLATSTKKK